MIRTPGLAKVRFGALGGVERYLGDPCGLPHSSASCFRPHVEGSSHFLWFGDHEQAHPGSRREEFPASPSTPLLQRERQGRSGSPQFRDRKTESSPLLGGPAEVA